MSAGVVVPLREAVPVEVRTARPAPLGEFCATCWGQGKVWELARGVLQAVPVPCDECFGTGRSWRAGA